MTLSPEVEAQILRYYHAEKWTVGTIAAQLRVHHTAVARVLSQAGLPRSGRPPRPSRIDPRDRRGSTLICRSSARPWRRSQP